MERSRNRFRAQGVSLASKMLQALADSVVDSEYEDMRRGLLCAAGFTSVLSSALVSGGQELAFIDIDGDSFPVDLTLRVAGES